MAQQVIAIAFDKESRADEALLTVVHMQQEQTIKIEDAVVVVKTTDGKVHIRQTTDPSVGQGAVSGGWWGVFIGLIFGGPVGAIGGAVLGGAAGGLYSKLVDTGLDDEWIKLTSQHIEPGTSALFLLLNYFDREVALKELSRFEGKILYTDLPENTRALIEEALHHHGVQSPTIDTKVV